MHGRHKKSFIPLGIPHGGLGEGRTKSPVDQIRRFFYFYLCQTVKWSTSKWTKRRKETDRKQQTFRKEVIKYSENTGE